MGRRRGVDGATKSCEYCAKLIWVPPSRIGKQRFCNNQCRHLAAQGFFACPACSKKFQRQKTNVRAGRAYCSRNCFKTAFTYPCETCTKEILRKPYMVANNLGRFCSRTCFHESRYPESFIVTGGYRVARVPNGTPGANSYRAKAAYMLEHRWVMQQWLGRVLTTSETVHHIDGDKLNNDIFNLQLRYGPHGKGQAMACLACGSQRIGPILLAGRK